MLEFLFSAVFSLIALSIFTAKSAVPDIGQIKTEESFGWSFVVGWIGFALCVIACSLQISICQKPEYENLDQVKC